MEAPPPPYKDPAAATPQAVVAAPHVAAAVEAVLVSVLIVGLWVAVVAVAAFYLLFETAPTVVASSDAVFVAAVEGYPTGDWKEGQQPQIPFCFILCDQW